MEEAPGGTGEDVFVREMPQTTNNRLIVYDLNLKAWLPPFSISAASICTGYHYNVNAPGRLGSIGVYAGGYAGQIMRLFGPGSTDDSGERITGFIETGPIHFGSPQYEKLLRTLAVYGKTVGGEVKISVFTDGNTQPEHILDFQGIGNSDVKVFDFERRMGNIKGRFFRMRVELAGRAEVFGLHAGVSVVRDW
jgi:hypothetical protein